MLLTILLVHCKSVSTSTSKSSPKAHEEDLTVYRPDFGTKPENRDSLMLEDTAMVNEELSELIEPAHHINIHLDSILDSIALADQTQSYFRGYTILLYSGNSREQATLTRGKAMQMNLEHEPDIVYTQPNWKVKIGQFYNKFDAQPLFADLKKKFPNAIIVPDRIYFEEEEE